MPSPWSKNYHLCHCLSMTQTGKLIFPKGPSRCRGFLFFVEIKPGCNSCQFHIDFRDLVRMIIFNAALQHRPCQCFCLFVCFYVLDKEGCSLSETSALSCSAWSPLSTMCGLPRSQEGIPCIWHLHRTGRTALFFKVSLTLVCRISLKSILLIKINLKSLKEKELSPSSPFKKLKV